jgi:hypothetical protein
MKKILSMKTKIQFIHQIFVLKDGRIIIYGGGNYDELFRCAVFNLKTGDNFNLKLGKNYDYKFIQMENGSVIAQTAKALMIFNINEKEIEIIKEMPIDIVKMFKLSNKEIMLFDYQNQKKVFVYENNDLVEVENKKIKILDKFSIGDEKICLINKNEIALHFSEKSFFKNSSYIGFFDLEKDEKIATIKYSGNKKFYLINENLFIFTDFNKIYPVHLKKHSKEKEITLEYGGVIDSILTLNEKQFIVSQDRYIHQFELGINNRINLINTVKLNNAVISKYPNNRFIFADNKVDDKIYLYN